ncbi:MAG TPA: hypothetical protein VKV19_16155 [Ktedonobacteraceae bacterium]|nr:hypothetical protein [Ktedonobacteraceae bacterium]
MIYAVLSEGAKAMSPDPPVEVEPAPARTLPNPAIWKQEPP